MQMEPDASVVIVSRNRAGLLSRAIDSVIKGNYPKEKYELIIIDDGSEKSFENLAAEKKKTFTNIRYFRQDSKGLAAGRNLGAEKARGKIVLYTDDDCIADKNWVKEMFAVFRGKNVIGAEGKITTDTPRRLFTNAPENLHGNSFIGANSGYLKKTVLALGYFEPMNIYKDDSEFAFRAMEKGRIVFAERAIVYHPLRKYAPLRFFDNLFRLKN